jgi:SAM-dependent methyltransferase
MEKPMSIAVKRQSPVAPSCGERAIAAAYNRSGDNYLAYADGDPDQLFAFAGQYAYGDSHIWELLSAKLAALRAAGKRSLRILDLGCGPGTWLRRVATQARAIGFETITARGFDIADAQVRRARELSAGLAALPGIALTFEVGDIFAPLAEADGSIDLALCLCGVLNHIPAAALDSVFAEIARVTSGYFVTSVRAVGSTPTVYVDAIEHARQFRQDNSANRLEVELDDGSRISLPSHLFGAAELCALVAPHLEIEDVSGLDLFHGRFADDPRWNPRGGADLGFARALDVLEKDHCRDAAFIDHATHLLLVAASKVPCDGHAQVTP